MSTQLYQAVADILRMPYFRNEQARSGEYNYGHEYAVAVRIKARGFVEHDKALYPNLKKGLLKKWSETGNDQALRKATQGLPPGSYILQPAGSQGFPDILVKDFGDRFVAVECKSGKFGVCPMWNDNLPKPDTIYVLSSGLINATTIFLGRDVMPNAMLESQLNMLKELNEIVTKYQKINAELDQFSRGWATKFRPQNFQFGPKAKTNYFSHPDRKKCETNALEFAGL